MCSIQCSDYKAGKISGQLCSDLCQDHKIQFGKCLTTVPEKHVFAGKWQEQEVILKLAMYWFTAYQHFEEIDDHSLVLAYKDYVSVRVKDLFGECPKCSQLTAKLVLLGDDNSNGHISASEARSFLPLLYQTEPMMLMVLNDSIHTLDYYGYCGGLYAVEKVKYIAEDLFGNQWNFIDLDLLPDVFEPVEEIIRYIGKKTLDLVFSTPCISTVLNDATRYIKSFIHTLFFQVLAPSKIEEFDFAFSLLDTILDLSSNPYGLIQSCDVHLGNFGITNSSLVKLMDLDSTYPNVLLQAILSQKTCIADADCWVDTHDDCVSTCDSNTGNCTTHVQRQDLQNICLHFHLVFKKNLYSEPNTPSLKQAIENLVLFCKNLPVADSLEEFQENVLVVRKELEYINLDFASGDSVTVLNRLR